MAHHRKRVAVVLSGGGAKGVAHVGALKVLERAGMPIDYIVGTSMGAIVGELYSIGYNADALDSLVRELDWKQLLSDKNTLRSLSLQEKHNQSTYLISRPIIRTDDGEAKGGFVAGTNLADLFSRLTVGYHDSIDFNNLPIPFACVATNIVDNSEVVMRSGWLSQAMRASMAIPGVFTPVRTDSMVLVDGGLKNNYPVDVARAMGADVVIGVSVHDKLRTASELNSASDILLQVIDYSTKNKFDANVAATDVLIRVNIDGYSAMSFNTKAIDTLIVRGQTAAEAQWEGLMRLKETIGLDSCFTPTHTFRSSDGNLPHRIRLVAVDCEGMSPADAAYLRRRYHLDEGDSISSTQLEDAMASLRTDMMYTSADYILRHMPGGYWLRVVVGERKVTQANLGVRFDSDDMVALQANTTLRFRMRFPLELSATVRLGKRYFGNVAAKIAPSPRHSLTLGYTYMHNDIDVYSHGDRDYNVAYNYHSATLSMLTLTGRNYGVEMGVRWENFSFGGMLYGQQAARQQIGDECLYSYRLSIHYDSENNRYFATRGAVLNAEYALTTDNFVGYHKNNPIQMASVTWRVALSPSKRFTIQPNACWRVVWGIGMPWCVGNFIGGDFAGHYIEQQLPFAGLGRLESTGNAFASGGLKLQQRIMDNNYLSLRLSLGVNADLLRHLHSSELMRGYQLSWAYNSMFGPIGASVGWSSVSKSPFFYVNLGHEF